MDYAYHLVVRYSILKDHLTLLTKGIPTIAVVPGVSVEHREARALVL